MPAPRTTADWKWNGGPPDISGFQTFGCRVYTHVNREIGTLDARGEEMRYLGCSHDSHFHHLYRARDRRVFTTDDVTFVETDIQLPDYSGNMEIELAGLQRITEDEQRLVDEHAERDDEVDWEQLQLDHITEHPELDDTDDAVMPTPADPRTMVHTPSVPAMVPTPSAIVDTNTTVPELSVTTRTHDMVQDPWAEVDGYTMVPQPSFLMAKR